MAVIFFVCGGIALENLALTRDGVVIPHYRQTGWGTLIFCYIVGLALILYVCKPILKDDEKKY